MAGSYNHVLDDAGRYRGVELLENMRDMHEAVEEMAFVLLLLSQTPEGKTAVEQALEAYFRRLRGEEPWPEWFSNR